MTLYNSIGQGYNHTRKPDKRIVEKIINLLDLPPGKTIADIGAGTGNYSNAIAQRLSFAEIADKGYQVIAIEPSEVMQSQAVDHSQVQWLTASAENISLPDNSVDGVTDYSALNGRSLL